jgi:threonine/homoserine/homoserine lactone efflux protein
MDGHLLAAFLIATLLVVMTPGPVMAIVAHNTLRHGATAGLLTAIGIELGELCLLGATFAGLMISGELVPGLFRWLTLAGAFYLVWLTVTALRSRCRAASRATAPRTRMPVVDGLTVAFGNPATLVFYTAFFPQFLDPSGSIARQALVLGAAYLCTALTFDLACVFILGRIRLLAGWTRFASFAELGSAVVYLAIAAIAVVGFIETSG